MFEEFDSISKKVWVDKVVQDLKGKAFDSLKWEIEPGLQVDPFYTAEDLDQVFTLPSGRPNNVWCIAESLTLGAGPTAPKKANAELLDMLESGVESPVIELDEALEKKAFFTLFKGVFPEIIQPHFSGAFTEVAPKQVLQLLGHLLKENQKSTKKQSVFLQVDPLGHFIEEQEFFESEEADFNSLVQCIEYADQFFPKARMIRVSGHYLHSAQDSVSRELAFILAFASEYLTQLTDRGLSAEQVANRMYFSVNVGGQYFVELAKIRALKIGWLAIQRAFGIEEPQEAIVHAITSPKTQGEDPNTNMIRSTTEALSAVLGGAQSLEVLPANVFKEPANDFTRRIARNVQHLMRSESHLDWVADPAAGSYYIETLSTKLLNAAWAKFQKIEGFGGVLGFLKEQD